MGSADVPPEGRLTRFFVRPEQVMDDSVHFGSDDAHHMFVVLRMRAGQNCNALDGTGRSLHVQLDQLTKSTARGRILRTDYPNTEAKVRITIAQALPRTFEKLEWVLEHATEIGAHDFIVFSSERGRDNSDRFLRKLPRWEEIVKTAAEQSGRTHLPTVSGIPSLSEVVASVRNYDGALMAYEHEQNISLRQALPRESRCILIIIGPEGGFSVDEVNHAREAGITTVSLGPRILRTETAALVMTSQVLFALDPDFSALPA